MRRGRGVSFVVLGWSNRGRGGKKGKYTYGRLGSLVSSQMSSEGACWVIIFARVTGTRKEPEGRHVFHSLLKEGTKVDTDLIPITRRRTIAIFCAFGSIIFTSLSYSGSFATSFPD